jgi:VanZ family protein
MRPASQRQVSVVLAATVLYWLVLFVLTHLPAARLPVVRVTDKTIHFATYAGLALLLFTTLSTLRRGWGRAEVAVAVLGICLSYAAVDEWTQIPFGRDCEMADWYADTAGAGTAVVAATLAATILDRRRNPRTW